MGRELVCIHMLEQRRGLNRCLHLPTMFSSNFMDFMDFMDTYRMSSRMSTTCSSKQHWVTGYPWPMKEREREREEILRDKESTFLHR